MHQHSNHRHHRLDDWPPDVRELYRRLAYLREIHSPTAAQSAEMMRLWIIAAHMAPTPLPLPPDCTGDPAPHPDDA